MWQGTFSSHSQSIKNTNNIQLTQADLIVTTLGTDPQVIAAARGLAGAEQNFNPFLVSIPSICSDPTLPVTESLRGVVPLVDPAVGGSSLENTNAASSLTTPFDATGLSVADVMAANGFSNFTTKAVDGTVGAAPAGSSSGDVAASSVAASVAVSSVASSSVAVAATGCVQTTFVTVTRGATSSTSSSESAVAATEVASTTAEAAATSTSTDTPAPASSNAITGVNPGFVASTISDLDFGLCVPTMKFEAGLDGRSDTEFTFQAIDPLVNKGQEEALNPNIITNRICDQLTNVCNANEAAKTACTAAKAQILALGTKDVTTADAWNTALGFAGTNTNPDNAPQAGLVGHD
jgi:hypothetical protein